MRVRTTTAKQLFCNEIFKEILELKYKDCFRFFITNGNLLSHSAPAINFQVFGMSNERSKALIAPLAVAHLK